jgi:hypothetical protein
MKMQKTLVTIGVVLGMLLTHISAVYAFPPLPCSYYGAVTLNGANVPVGTPVSAWIGGVRYAAQPAGVYAGETIYSLVVPGDDPATAQIEGGAAGNTVMFQIGDHSAGQSAAWVSGGNIELDLAASVSTAPAIVLSASLNPFTSAPGAPSSAQEYTVSASNLSAALNISAPADFEISRMLTGGFGSSLSLTPVDGAVASTTIYVRFHRIGAGASGGNIIHASAGAASQNVAVSGMAAAEKLFLPLVMNGGRP